MTAPKKEPLSALDVIGLGKLLGISRFCCLNCREGRHGQPRIEACDCLCHGAPDLIPWSRRTELYWLVLLGINAGLAVGLGLAAWFKGQVPGGFAVGSAAFAVTVFALSVRRRQAMRGREVRRDAGPYS